MNPAIMVDQVVIAAVEIQVMMMKATPEVHQVVRVVAAEAMQAVALEDLVARDRDLNRHHQAVHAVAAPEAARLVQAAALTEVQEQRAEVVNQKHPSKSRM